MKKIAALILIALMTMGKGMAESAWVICQPDSFVNMRANPSFDSDVVAYPEAGEMVELAGRKVGDWTKVKYFCEAGEGWIFSGYLTMSKPDLYQGGKVAVTDYGKVRARRYADGPIRKMLAKGTELVVYAASDEWAVTNQGYVKTDCLIFNRLE